MSQLPKKGLDLRFIAILLMVSIAIDLGILSLYKTFTSTLKK